MKITRPIATFFLIFAAALVTACAAPTTLSSPVESWLTAQTQLQTWSADLTETRTLQSLTAPLTSRGHIWFAAPDKFRWELGHPAQTIAVCTGTNLVIVYPRLKRVETVSLAGKQAGEWRSVLDMLEAGFPHSEMEFMEHYQILSQTGTNNTCQLLLRPNSAELQRMVPRIEIDIDVRNYSLSGTELQFSDGSTLRNDFFNAVGNVTLNKDTFSPDIPTNYTVVQPLSNSQ